jgi:hypothetical protein
VPILGDISCIFDRSIDRSILDFREGGQYRNTLIPLLCNTYDAEYYFHNSKMQEMKEIASLKPSTDKLETVSARKKL